MTSSSENGDTLGLRIFLFLFEFARLIAQDNFIIPDLLIVTV